MSISTSTQIVMDDNFRCGGSDSSFCCTNDGDDWTEDRETLGAVEQTVHMLNADSPNTNSWSVTFSVQIDCDTPPCEFDLQVDGEPVTPPVQEPSPDTVLQLGVTMVKLAGELRVAGRASKALDTRVAPYKDDAPLRKVPGKWHGQGALTDQGWRPRPPTTTVSGFPDDIAVAQCLERATASKHWCARGGRRCWCDSGGCPHPHFLAAETKEETAVLEITYAIPARTRDLYCLTPQANTSASPAIARLGGHNDSDAPPATQEETATARSLRALMARVDALTMERGPPPYVG
ncbi:hypothetical protein C8R46DRAFT_1352217 [Mycena filopes]|nr:hypothetical protein C8R46DRAFT_1352217 [Mycena filopes]